MDAIKKKMQAMKLEKDNAMDRADACEQQVLLHFFPKEMAITQKLSISDPWLVKPKYT